MAKPELRSRSQCDVASWPVFRPGTVPMCCTGWTCEDGTSAIPPSGPGSLVRLPPAPSRWLRWPRSPARPPAGAEPVAAVAEILTAVRERGDDAVRELTKRFDGVALDDLLV